MCEIFNNDKNNFREEIEKKHDVTKRMDLSDFYHNLCSRNVAFSSTQNENTEESTKPLNLNISTEQDTDEVKESMNTNIKENKVPMSIPQITVKKQKLNVIFFI